MTQRPHVQKQNHTWPEAEPWERLRIDWAYIKDQGNILIIVDAGTDWIEAFPCTDRSSLNVIKFLSAICLSIWDTVFPCIRQRQRIH